MPNIGLIKILNLFGFDTCSRIKIVRHIDKKNNIESLILNNYFELYQKIQKKPIFNHFDYIISFIASSNTKAKFYGIYKVNEPTPLKADLIPVDCPYTQQWLSNKYYYNLKRLEEYDFLRNRLIIEWGKSTKSWHQKLLPERDKEVLEIRPKGESLEVFEDYLDFTLTYKQLKYIVNNSDANYEWRARLSAVAGVYLILDSKTGQQYIGSAYGSKGIWGRWEEYARNGHGNNITLVSILNENPERRDDFVFSILQILPKSCAKEKVIKIEHRYMFKLGTKVTGLNN
jgi:hypothetical protein